MSSKRTISRPARDKIVIFMATSRSEFENKTLTDAIAIIEKQFGTTLTRKQMSELFHNTGIPFKSGNAGLTARHNLNRRIDELFVRLGRIDERLDALEAYQQRNLNL